jgi:2-phospho-L-lactate guanylyltransferase
VVAVVVPFRAGGKSRLPEEIRVDVALAMLADVLEAAIAFAPTWLVTDDPAAALLAQDVGADVVDDPGGGQGAAVAAALAALDGPCVVVNADVPRVRPSDLNALAVPARSGAVGIVPARDGTTNALALPWPEAFAPLYGRSSAVRFRTHADELGLVWHDVGLPNLVDDVDTPADLLRVGPGAGARTRALLEAIRA